MKLIAESTPLLNRGQGMRVKHIFLNCSLGIETSLHPYAFYRELRSIEVLLGRIRSIKNAPRTVDLDVLFSENLTYKRNNFFIPHKSTFTRSFFVQSSIELLQKASKPLHYKFIQSQKVLAREYLVTKRQSEQS